MKGTNVRLENQDFTKSSKSFLQDLKNSVELPRLNGVFETMTGFAWLRRILDNRMLMIVLLLLLPFCWWFAPIAYIGLMCLDAKFDLLLNKGAKNTNNTTAANSNIKRGTTDSGSVDASYITPISATDNSGSNIGTNSHCSGVSSGDSGGCDSGGDGGGGD